MRVASKIQILRRPAAARAPAIKRSESPGRYGVMTSPVSKNIMRKRMTYVQSPYCWRMTGRYLSKCKITSKILKGRTMYRIYLDGSDKWLRARKKKITLF